MANVETGLLQGHIPFIRAGAGPRHAVVFFGVNALFQRLDQVPNPARYAAQVNQLLPDFCFTILGYPPGSSLDQMVARSARALPDPPDLVMGISFGGFIALRFAAEYPNCCPRLVLLVTAHRFSSEGERRVARQRDALAHGNLPRLLRENALLFRRPWYNAIMGLRLYLGARRRATLLRSPSEILTDYESLLGSELKENQNYARRIQCPALLIAGTADPFFDPTAVNETARAIPDSRTCFFDKETHMLPIERSREVAATIAAFTG